MQQIADNRWVCTAHRGEEWQLALAMGARLPCEVPLPFSQRRALASWPDLPRDTAFLLANDGAVTVVTDLATHLRTPDTLAYLAQDTLYMVRENVADNPSAPAHVLRRLSQDAEQYVRRAVARNSNTPGTVLRILASDSSYRVRAAVARHANTADDVLELLLEDVDTRVRAIAARQLERRRLVAQR